MIMIRSALLWPGVPGAPVRMRPRSPARAVGRIADVTSSRMCWVRGSTAGGGDALAPAGPALARALVGQAVAYEFGAGGDAELGEDLMQVVVDGAGAEDQL